MEIWTFNYSFFFLNFLNTCLFLFYKVLCLSSDCLWLRLVHRHRAQRSSDHVTQIWSHCQCTALRVTTIHVRAIPWTNNALAVYMVAWSMYSCVVNIQQHPRATARTNNAFDGHSSLQMSNSQDEQCIGCAFNSTFKYGRMVNVQLWGEHSTTRSGNTQDEKNAFVVL